VGEEQIDASLGLAFSLTVFERYRRSGLLQAELHHVPGVRGRCKGCLHLVEGKVALCSLENPQGQRQPINMDVLIQLDSRRGPFEWSLTPLPPPPQVSVGTVTRESSARLTANVSIPRQAAPLNVEKLEGWTPRQRKMLTLVFDAIDGQRTVDAILAETPLPSTVVEEALRILLSMRVIIMSS
jgi:hypothetical protein